MLFIFIAWLLMLLTFAIWLRALHSIPIYAHTPFELQSQNLQIKTVFNITQILLALSVACIALHFVMPEDAMHSQTHHVRSNLSIYESVLAPTHNFTS